MVLQHFSAGTKIEGKRESVVVLSFDVAASCLASHRLAWRVLLRCGLGRTDAHGGSWTGDVSAVVPHRTAPHRPIEPLDEIVTCPKKKKERTSQGQWADMDTVLFTVRSNVPIPTNDAFRFTGIFVRNDLLFAYSCGRCCC